MPRIFHEWAARVKRKIAKERRRVGCGGARRNRLGEPNGAQQARARLVLARRQRTLAGEHRFGYEKDPRAAPTANPACLHDALSLFLSLPYAVVVIRLGIAAREVPDGKAGAAICPANSWPIGIDKARFGHHCAVARNSRWAFWLTGSGNTAPICYAAQRGSGRAESLTGNGR